MQRTTRSSVASASPRGFVQRVLVVTHASPHEVSRCKRLQAELKRHLPNAEIVWLDPKFKKGETAEVKRHIRGLSGIDAPDFYRLDPSQPCPFAAKSNWLTKPGYDDMCRYHLDPDHNGPGAVSCVLGHMLAWCYAEELRRGSDHNGYTLVLESDATLVPDFNQRMNEALKELDRGSNESNEAAQDEEEMLFGDWTDLTTFDFVYLGTTDLGPRFKVGVTCAEHEWTAPARRTYPSVLDQPGFSVVSVGYLLTPAGASKLLDLVNKVADKGAAPTPTHTSTTRVPACSASPALRAPRSACAKAGSSSPWTSFSRSPSTEPRTCTRSPSSTSGTTARSCARTSRRRRSSRSTTTATPQRRSTAQSA